MEKKRYNARRDFLEAFHTEIVNMRNLGSVVSADKREWERKKKVVLQRPFMRVRHFNFTQQTVTAIDLNSGNYFFS